MQREASNTYAGIEDVIAPEDAASSRARGWYGVEVLRASIAGGELDVAGLQSHTVAFNAGPSFRLEGRVDGGDASASMDPNSFKVVPAGAASRWRWRTGSPIQMLHVSVSAAAFDSLRAESGLPRAEIVTRVGIADAAAARVAAELGAELASDGARGRLYAESLAHDFMVHLLRTGSSAGVVSFDPPRRIAKRVMLELEAYIDAHLGHEITLERLAAVAGLSRFHFVRLFRQSVNVTPYQYVLERRLARAERLIRATALPLCDVAAAVGLADQSHLTRLMRRRYGTTPARLRLEAS